MCIMEVFLCLFGLLSVFPLYSETVSLAVLPSEAEEGSKLTLVCRTDRERAWTATWYRNNNIVLTMGRQLGGACIREWNIPRTGVYNDTQTKCDGNTRLLTFQTVTKELNNTRWNCKIDGELSQTVTISVVEKQRATLSFSPTAVQLGSRLDIKCEYSKPAWSSTWYKDGTKILYIRRTNQNTCLEEGFGQQLSDISVTCSQNSKRSVFVLTFLKVKRDLNNTYWDCRINNSTATTSITKQIPLFGEPEVTTVSKIEVTSRSLTAPTIRTTAPAPELGTQGALLIGGAAGVLVTVILTVAVIYIWCRMKKSRTTIRGTVEDHGSTSAGAGAEVVYDLPFQTVQQAQSTVAPRSSKDHQPGSVYSNLRTGSQDNEHMYCVIDQGAVH